MTITLIIISSIIVYALMGLFFFHLYMAVRKKYCEVCQGKTTYFFSSCEHEFAAFWQGLLWPVVPLLTIIGLGLFFVGYYASGKIQEWTEKIV